MTSEPGEYEALWREIFEKAAFSRATFDGRGERSFSSEIAIAVLRDHVEAKLAEVRAERDSALEANFRQATCIHYTAQALGPETAATVDALPKAAQHAARTIAEQAAELERLREALAEVARDRGGYMGEYYADCQQIARTALQETAHGK